MTGRLAIVVWLCGATASVHAHRLDEYLQAAQVAVSTDRIGISLSLSPGISVADAIVSRLDQDGDGRILPEEAEAYGREVVADLRVSVDAQPLSLTLRRVEAPPIPELREGVGSIRLEADAVPPSLAPGAHTLRLENRHGAAGSVYLANALLPDDDAIQIRRQQRDSQQQTLLVEYGVTPAAQANAAWLAVAAAALLLHARWRRGPSAVHRPPSTVYRLPSTVHRLPFTVYRKNACLIDSPSMSRRYRSTTKGVERFGSSTSEKETADRRQ